MNVSQINNNLNFNSKQNVRAKDDSSFSQYLKKAVDSANEAQIKADEETNKLITGEAQDIHQVMIAAEEARLKLELVMQVRTKLVESYQEISRMQI